MSKVYLDKGALSELWKSPEFSSRDLLRIRRRLCSGTFERRPRVVLGPQVLSELANMVGRQQFNDELFFLRSIPDYLYLKAVRGRVAAEIARATGDDSTPWLSADEAESLLFAATNDPAMWAAERKRLATDKRNFGRRKRKGRAAFQLTHPTRKLQGQAAKLFYSEPVEMVEHWVIEQLRRNRFLLKLPPNENDWPSPKSLPTIWGVAAYHSARDYLVMRDGRSLDENDQWT